MKHLFLTLFFATLLLPINAKEKEIRIKSAEISHTDIINVLDRMGIHIAHFDLSELDKKEYNINFYIDEYKTGKKIDRIANFKIGRNRKDLPKKADEREAFIKSRNLNVSKKAKYWTLNQMSIYVIPESDSTVTITISCPRGAATQQVKIAALPQNKMPIYDFRTFEIAPVTEKTQEIPLAIYNSFFFDEKHNISRSCYGKITAEMSEDIFDILPHYYVIGITLKEVKKIVSAIKERAAIVQSVLYIHFSCLWWEGCSKPINIQEKHYRSRNMFLRLR